MKQYIKEEPAKVGALLAAIYATLVMLWRLSDGEPDTVFQPDVFVAGVLAVYQLLVTKRLVTPLARPRDAERRPLRPAQQDRPPQYPA